MISWHCLSLVRLARASTSGCPATVGPHIGVVVPAVLMAALSGSSPVFGQEPTDLSVAAGDTFEVTADLATMRVRRWVMGSGSTITLTPDVREWKIYAQEAVIDADVTIRASGADGAAGPRGEAGSSGARCENGRPGSDGVRGTNGLNGRRVEIVMGVRSVRGLVVDVRGGRGGDGGPGGAGGRGGRAACNQCINTCRGGSGGNGGTGGAAGDGGDGGSIAIRYWPVESEIDLNVDPQRAGGDPGSVGAGGPAGGAGAGISCGFPCPNRAGGQSAGGRGGDGQRGLPGSRGDFSMRLIAPPAGGSP